MRLLVVDHTILMQHGNRSDMIRQHLWGYYQSNQPERFKDGYRPLRMCKHFKTDQCWRGQEQLGALKGFEVTSETSSLHGQDDCFQDMFWLPIWHGSFICLTAPFDAKLKLRCTYAHSLEELHPASPDLPRVEVKETNALAEQQMLGLE